MKKDAFERIAVKRGRLTTFRAWCKKREVPLHAEIIRAINHWMEAQELESKIAGRT